MAEEPEWQVQLWSKGLAEGLNQRSKSGKRRFLDARATPGQLNRQNLNRFWQLLLPGAKGRFTAARIRETEQAHSGPQVRPAPGEPGTFSCDRQIQISL